MCYMGKKCILCIVCIFLHTKNNWKTKCTEVIFLYEIGSLVKNPIGFSIGFWIAEREREKKSDLQVFKLKIINLTSFLLAMTNIYLNKPLNRI